MNNHKGPLPAVLFRTEAFIVGSADMDNNQCGMYIRLLCYQHQKGHLEMSFIKKTCQGNPPKIVIDKFIKDANGKWYNEVMEKEIKIRRKFSKLQQKKSLSYWKTKARQRHPAGYPNGYPRALELDIAPRFNIKLKQEEGGCKGEEDGIARITGMLQSNGLDEAQIREVFSFMPNITPAYITEKAAITASRGNVRSKPAFFLAALLNNYAPTPPEPPKEHPAFVKARTFGYIEHVDWQELNSEMQSLFDSREISPLRTIHTLKKISVDNSGDKP
jgi:hypothetical protein